MADVLIVCVREDEPLAKAFDDMFERAGLHVGGAPGAVEDMRACGAALVVWSQASIRSRAFLDAAQRAVNAGKAVVACLISPPPPASINHAPAFDLSRWTGDPDDPALDPLFFAVDRMAAAQRAAEGVTAGAGATARAEPANYAPPPPATPPYARARPSAGASQAASRPNTNRPATHSYDPPPRHVSTPPKRAPDNEPRAEARRAARAPDSDPVAAEAQNWAAIRNSRNPEDFLKHLADFGSDGAFAELAQMKLAELEAEGRRRRQTPATAARQDSLRNQSVRLDPTRQTAPQQRPDQDRSGARRSEAYRQDPYLGAEPVRQEPRADARQTPTRPPPAQFEPIRGEARTRTPPRQEPPEWRDDTRERRRGEAPPKQGGGAARIIFLILLLGGAALGLGLFAGDRLGGGLSFFTSGAETQNAAKEEPWENGPTAETETTATEGEATAASDIAAAALDTPTEPTTRQQPERQQPTRAEREREAANRAAENAAARSRAGSDRDVAVTTPTEGPGMQQQPVVPPLPEVQIVSAPVTPPPESTRVQQRPPQVIWAQRPGSARMAQLFPDRALRDNIGGRVELDCVLDGAGVPRCAVARETPGGYGFGSAAIRASTQYRANSALDDGTPSSGAQTRLTIVFRAPGQ
ncbi:MAG: hypothetical protein AB7O04_13570 [Hyphomonadaceae bacterium]